MSRMRRTLASVVGVLALAGSAPGQPGRPRWQVDAGDRYCTVIRSPAAPAEPTLAIRYNLYGLGADLLFSGSSLPVVGGPVRIVTEYGESQPLAASTTRAGDGTNLLQVAHLTGTAHPQLRMEDASSIEVRRGDRVVVRLALRLPDAAIETVRACQTDAMTQAGFGPDAIEEPLPAPGAPVSRLTIGTAAPLSGGNPVDWVSASDYPEAAVLRGRGGQVGVLLRVDPDGSVGRCFVGLSSGSADLDDATCRAVLARGRWDPVAGRPRLARLYFSWSSN